VLKVLTKNKGQNEKILLLFSAHTLKKPQEDIEGRSPPPQKNFNGLLWGRALLGSTFLKPGKRGIVKLSSAPPGVRLFDVFQCLVL
jgi:hypothetical protein